MVTQANYETSIMRLGIRSKLLLIIVGILLVVQLTLTYLQLSLQSTAFAGELQKRTALLKENLTQRSLSQADALSSLVAEDIASFNFFSLTNKIQQAIEASSELDYVIILDRQNKIYVHTEQPELQQSIYSEPDTLAADELVFNTRRYTVTYTRDAVVDNVHELPGMDTAMEYKFPINHGETTWGNILLGYSLAQLNEQVKASQDENNKNQNTLILKTLYFTLAVLVVAWLLISQIIKHLISPILILSRFSKDLATGDFSRIHRISSTRHDELGMLTQNFANMAIKLEESYKKQADYSQTLENTVSQRTQALHLKNTELVQALTSLEESQQQLIHSEKMAALGQLIAGIAHEINTPLGAIQATVGNTSKYLSLFINALPDFLASSAVESQDFFCNLMASSQYGALMSTREERSVKRQVIKTLEEHGVDQADELAEMLVDMELSEDVERLVPRLSSEKSFETVVLAHHLTGIGRNSATIQMAIGRASKVVFALKNFTHLSRSDQAILTDINQGIRTVLVLYQGLLRRGCEVVEHFGNLSEVNCYPDELNQVWTNLIHNSLHAMQNKGILTIQTEQLENNIMVTISDTGSGIPLEAQPKIFGTFFTTKPAGEGSGLGLGICKRIIDKHQGSIGFTSEPGKTSFIVILPILN
ncbi:MAG: signal transduction histidine kinase [Oleiphilaceae bacterium]|jgi:signal transduction histidine kinase